jgi:DNA topoisomerase-2
MTPLVKVTKGDEFWLYYSMPEYENWKKSNQGGKGYKFKYNKGVRLLNYIVSYLFGQLLG